ncbi:phosphodiester glycosidase family protein [Candidatus Woesebacteria bacterium]|nr:phosphodiester glycosidase family protein [Candidatus Woesebacteria bacterium]
MTTKGFAQILPIIVLLIIASVSVVIFKNKNLLSFSQSTLLSTPNQGTAPTPSFSPSPTPTSSPTIPPTSKPTPVKTITPSPPTVSGPPGAGYSRITVHTEKGDFVASVLSVDLNTARMITDTANELDCGTGCPVTSLANFVNKNSGFAGVNGSYFCPETYPDCASKTNSFDFPVYNSRLGKWINQGNIFWNGRSMVYVDGEGVHYNQSANSFSGGLTAGIINFPGLLDGGNVQIDDNQSGLSDKQRAVGTKVGIGVRGSKNIMVVVASSVNMQQFAYVFKALGADGALNLDTGGSTAMYYNGRYTAGPGRNIPNAIIFAR